MFRANLSSIISHHVSGVRSGKCLCPLYDTLYILSHILSSHFRMRHFEIDDSQPIARLFSHSAGAESAVHPRRGSRRRCPRVASALLGDGGTRQGRRRDGMEGNSEVRSKSSSFTRSIRRLVETYNDVYATCNR